MKLFLHIGEVVGRGKVPLDMLRYDRAFPYRETDSAEMERRSNWMGTKENDQQCSLQIATLRTTKHEPWNHMRWYSFNRTIKHIETKEVSG